ncbi:MAG: acireductone synthase [Cytophagales bacterium]|nr:MAG: acireductone synthase [Cytophagales bacterium]
MQKINNIQFVLTDIEGTTTSISFVVDVLFPYFKQHFQSFVDEYFSEKFIKDNFELVKKTIKEEENIELNDLQVIEKLLYWVDIDRKHFALKNLQGLVWKLGYEKGDLKGHIYSDVVANLIKWHQNKITLGIYSSGSVTAQKLLFGSSIEGDLTHYFSYYFDTQIGGKREITAYENILKEIQNKISISPNNILFLSDIEQELDAAKANGFQTLQLVRGETLPSQKHQIVRSFDEIVLL